MAPYHFVPEHRGDNIVCPLWGGWSNVPIGGLPAIDVRGGDQETCQRGHFEVVITVRRQSKNANQLIHPIPTSATPGELRPRGLLLAPVLEWPGLIGMGNEER